MSCTRGCCASHAEHYGSLVMGTAQSDGTRFETMLDKDRPAYKRMRDEGLQPKSVRGAARIEANASSVFEVETGRILPQRLANQVDSAQSEAKAFQAGVL